MNYKVKTIETLCLFLLILSCCGKEKEIRPTPSSEIKKSILTSSKSGKKTWRLTSEKITMKDNKTYLYNLKLELFKGDSLECTITGNEGIIDGDKISLKGSITASTKIGATLTTSSLNFSEKTNFLSTDDRVSFIKKDLILKGSGFVADRSFGNVKIKKDVEVVFK
ncbi:MAG: LPS export ABC transporter periplasmic protein LptC [bacterium]